jgi:hypothetical protein
MFGQRDWLPAYLLTVKKNQPALHLELVDLFRAPSAPLLAAPR